MATLGDLKRWNGAALDQIATAIRQRQQVLMHSGDDFTRTLPVPGWTGAAADQATAAHKTLTTWLDQAAGGVAVVGKALIQAADAIPAVQRAIGDAEALADKYGFTVTDDGRVVDRYAGRLPPPELHPDDRIRVQQQVTDDLTQALRTANDIDADLASVFQRAQHGDLGAGAPTVTAAAAAGAADPGLTLPTPPPNGTPSQNAGWWASLSPAGQAILEHDHPDRLGNLDGLPGSVRSTANIARLPAEHANLQTQLAAAKQKLAQDSAHAGFDKTDHDLANIEQLQTKLKSLDMINTTMKKGGRQLLTLDTTGDRVEAAVAVGDVDTAKYVAVFTPGFTSTVNGSLKEYDGNMSDLKSKTADLLNRNHSNSGVATVTWIGYQAPQLSDVLAGSKSVASDHLAQVGAPKLDGFLNGIGAAHDESGQPLHLTALGHSYGSLTTGIALHQHTPVQDAVVFGSPGMNATHRADLQIPTGHLYAEESDHDLIPDLDIANHFGHSPYDDVPSSALDGVDRLSTDAATAGKTPLLATHGHTDYLTDHSTSQYNMAAIIAGHPELRVEYR
jgi:Alpha/beta hydrolase